MGTGDKVDETEETEGAEPKSRAVEAGKQGRSKKRWGLIVATALIVTLVLALVYFSGGMEQPIVAWIAETLMTISRQMLRTL